MGMTDKEKIEFLIRILEKENKGYDFSGIQSDRRLYLRALMNITMPYSLVPSYYETEYSLLKNEADERPSFSPSGMIKSPYDRRLCLFKGDITEIRTDAIVNAANSDLLGCFHPLHNCIDNIIGSRAGLALRRELITIKEKEGIKKERTGNARSTKAYALPAKHIFHTVGPVVPSHKPSEHDRESLRSCYISCLMLLESMELESIAFPAISTGVFGYPKKEAAKEAVNAVREYLENGSSIKNVCFIAFEDEDFNAYKKELGCQQ